MNTSLFQPLLGVLAAGILSGSVLAPLKFQRGWRFEQTWLLYSVLAYLVSPWVVGWATVPRLLEVYRAAGTGTVVLTALCGFGWGMAVVLNGYAVTLVGLAVTTGIVMGSSIAVGSIAALLLLRPEDLFTAGGALLLLINLGLVAGVALCSRAGQLREKHQRAGLGTLGGALARKGVVLCLVAGVLSTLFNVALAYGQIISRHAEAAGATPFAASNAVWAVAVSAGSAPGILWSLWRLFRGPKEAARAEAPQWLPNAARCAAMALLWIAGTVLYGATARMMGPVGPALGWPAYMSSIIVTAAFWGWTTGEWKGAGPRPVRMMMAGLAVLLVFVVLMGWLGSSL